MFNLRIQFLISIVIFISGIVLFCKFDGFLLLCQTLNILFHLFKCLKKTSHRQFENAVFTALGLQFAFSADFRSWWLIFCRAQRVL